MSTTNPAERAAPAPTLEDVARLAGVSRATASRALNGTPTVSAGASEAVHHAAQVLGYSANLAARMLVTGRSDFLAVLVPESDLRVFSDPFFSEVYHGVATAFADHQAQVILAMAKAGEPPERMCRYLTSGRIDGAVVTSHHGTALPEMMARLRRPVVFVGDPGVRGLPFVDLDHESAARVATGHLLRAGRRSIATISGPLDMIAGARRHAGFLAAMADAGLQPVAVEEGAFTAESGQSAAERLVASGVEFDALFAASDQMAIAALHVLAAHGRRVPDDVAVVGFDDSVAARTSTPPLTTMSNPAHQMALTAGRMLRAALEGRPFTSPVILGSELVVRQSA